MTAELYDGYTIRAIPTQYGGNRFKSKLEAMWAVFLDYAQVEYKYEPYTFEIGENHIYTPDFYLPKQDIFLEIKPNRELTHDELAKAKTLIEEKDYNVYIVFLHGRPELGAASYYELYQGRRLQRVHWVWYQGAAYLVHEDVHLGEPDHPMLYHAVQRSFNHEYVELDNED